MASNAFYPLPSSGLAGIQLQGLTNLLMFSSVRKL